MDSFFVALNAVMPFLLYISFGYGVRRTELVDDDFLNKLNKLIFRAFFPILMFQNIYKTDSNFRLDIRLVIFAIVSLLILQAILILVVPKFVKKNPVRGVLIQAIYRSNFVLFGIPLTISVFGNESATVAAMMVAIVIPLYNVSAVVILEMFRGNDLNFKVLLKNVVTNPLILGAVAGLIFFGLQIKLPGFLADTVAQFSNLTTPLALFVLGGTMHFSAIRSNAKYLAAGMISKLLVIPAIIMTAASLMGFRGVELFVLLAMYATPVATASYSMAQNMGGDGELAGQFVVISTAVSVLTIFMWIFILKSMMLI